jgi:hypothetical protein
MLLAIAHLPPRWNDIRDCPFLFEHILAVTPNNEAGNDEQQVCVVGLRIRKDRVHQLEVEKRRQQNAPI